MGEKEHGKRVAAYIGGAKKKIVVDTGPPDLERSLKYHPYSKSEPRKPEQEMVAQLAKAGVTPEEIDIVVLTHLHWDHVGDVTKFPNAEFIEALAKVTYSVIPAKAVRLRRTELLENPGFRVALRLPGMTISSCFKSFARGSIVSQEELRFALNPLPCLYVAYEALQLGMQPEFLKVIERIKTVKMKEKEIVEGVRVIPLPGHTPGSIGVVVDTEKGPYIITGDAVPKYGNLKGAPEERQPYLMTGIYTDMMAMWKSFERIDEIVGGDYSKVIPGHDPLVFQKERYP